MQNSSSTNYGRRNNRLKKNVCSILLRPKLFLMKRLALFSLFVLLVSGLAAQTNGKLPALDKSPMDMVYYPANYPVLKIQEKANEPLVARVIYSRPQKGSRSIFGDLVEYGQVWRLGANEATEIEFFREVKIGGKKIPKGRYTVYALVNPEAWTMILNKETDIWGAFKYDEKKDVVRVKVPVQKTTEKADAFTILLDKAGDGINMVACWDDEKVALPIALK